MSVAELIAALSHVDPSATVHVFARTERGDAISTDRFEIRIEPDDEGPSVTLAAGWD